MIKIKATSDGERTQLDMNVQGRGVDIIDEAAHILTHLPKVLIEADPKAGKLLIKAITAGMESIMDEYEEEQDGELN